MNARETAWRLFSSELNGATYEIKAATEKAPSYIVTRLGAMVNRVLMAGVLTEKESVGSQDEPMWRGRVQDLAGGSFFINVGGRYQPEAAIAMDSLEPPAFVAVVGKVRSYTTDDGRVFVSVRPERIIKITEEVRAQWALDAAKSTWGRMLAMRKAAALGDGATEEALAKAGMPQREAQGIATALAQYGPPASAPHLKSIQTALRMVLPDDNIDLGLPEDMPDSPDEIVIEGKSDSEHKSEIEDIVLALLDELDTDGKGAPRDELERRAEAEGISSMELEEVSNALMDKGQVYEPNLRHLKRI